MLAAEMGSLCWGALGQLVGLRSLAVRACQPVRDPPKLFALSGLTALDFLELRLARQSAWPVRARVPWSSERAQGVQAGFVVRAVASCELGAHP